jgi:hypothetical protein
MAKPIKDTPVIKGKDAQRFFAKMANSHKNKVSKAERAEIKADFNKLNSIAKF